MAGVNVTDFNFKDRVNEAAAIPHQARGAERLNSPVVLAAMGADVGAKGTTTTYSKVAR